MTVDAIELDEQIRHLAALTKSTDVVLRAQAEDALGRLTATTSTPWIIEKVGPKGYIHGWIYVGPQAAGARVFHSTHGHGTVHRHEGGKVHVGFDSGKKHVFEAGEHRPGGAHFVERKAAAAHPSSHDLSGFAKGDPVTVHVRQGKTRQNGEVRTGTFVRANDKAITIREPDGRGNPREKTWMLSRVDRVEPAKPVAADAVQHHLDSAQTALAEGRHADAVNHLTAAAGHAPNKDTRAQIERQRNVLAGRITGSAPAKPARAKTPKPRAAAKPAPARTVGTAQEEIDHARAGVRDYSLTQDRGVKRAEAGVHRSARDTGGSPNPGSVDRLHAAYAAAAGPKADESATSAWQKLSPNEQHRAVTDHAFGDSVLQHLHNTREHTAAHNNPTTPAEARAAAAARSDATYHAVHGMDAQQSNWRAQHTGRRLELENHAGNDRGPAGMAAALELLPPRADDARTRQIAEAITPKVDPSLTGDMRAAADARRAAQVDVAVLTMHNDALGRRADGRALPQRVRDVRSGPVPAAVRAEQARTAEEWGQVSTRLDEAKQRAAAAGAEFERASRLHDEEGKRQTAAVSQRMREAFAKIPEPAKSTEGKDIARAAGVPRTPSKLTGRERELARDVNQRADILSAGRDKSGSFNRQADVVEATHAELSGSLHPDAQDRLDAAYDQARRERGDGPAGIYRDNLNESIHRWSEFQRAKTGVPPRDEDERAMRETLATQVQGKEPELAAQIRAGNVTPSPATAGHPAEVRSLEAQLAAPGISDTQRQAIHVQLARLRALSAA